MPPAPISAATRVYGISLGGSDTDRSETCLTGADCAGRAGLPRHWDNESCDPSRDWRASGHSSVRARRPGPRAPRDPARRLLVPRHVCARRLRRAFPSRLRSRLGLLAKLRAVPARWRSHCGAVTVERPAAVTVSIRQRTAHPQNPVEGLIRQIFELLPRGVLGRCHSTSRAVPRSPGATHWSRPRPICRISTPAVYPAAAKRVSQSLHRSTK